MMWLEKKVGLIGEHLPRKVYPNQKVLAANTHYLPHSHFWGQIAYSKNGVMRLNTAQASYILPPEQALWIPPHAEHEVFCRHGMSFESIYIESDFAQQLGGRVKNMQVSPLLKALIIEVSNWSKDYPDDHTHLAVIQVLMDQLQAAPENDLFMPKSYDKRLVPIVEALNQTPEDAKTLEQWSQLVGASSRTLNRLFNTHFGMGFSAWRRKLRVLGSIEELEQGKTVSEVAFSFGYASVSAFNSAFKAVTGEVPSQFLKR